MVPVEISRVLIVIELEPYQTKTATKFSIFSANTWTKVKHLSHHYIIKSCLFFFTIESGSNTITACTVKRLVRDAALHRFACEQLMAPWDQLTRSHNICTERRNSIWTARSAYTTGSSSSIITTVLEIICSKVTLTKTDLCLRKMTLEKVWPTHFLHVAYNE